MSSTSTMRNVDVDKQRALNAARRCVSERVWARGADCCSAGADANVEGIPLHIVEEGVRGE